MADALDKQKDQDLGALKEAAKRLDAAAGQPPAEVSTPLADMEVKLAGYLGDITGGDVPEGQLQLPPRNIAADLAVGLFAFQQDGHDVKKLAEQLSTRIEKGGLPAVDRAESAGPYVNLHLASEQVDQAIVEPVLSQGESYGSSDAGAGQKVVIEYSSPNVAKPIGVGHLRSTIIGESLARIYEASGYALARLNYLGDWGTQFGSLLYALREFGTKADVADYTLAELKDLYVDFHAREANDEQLRQAAQTTFAQLENKNPELVKLWEQLRVLSTADYQRVYEEFGVAFDAVYGESLLLDTARELVERLAKSHKFINEDNGALVVELPDLPTFLLRKSDGASLYHSRDLDNLRLRTEIFKPASIMIVAGQEQELHFRQLFALARATQLVPGKMELEHVGFGLVTVAGKKMSTRRGSLVELDELLARVTDKALEIVKANHPDMGKDEQEKISRQIAIGSIIYSDLKQDRLTNVQFDWDRVLSYEAGGGAYILYTAVRLKSLIDKAKATKKKRKDTDKSDQPDSYTALTRRLLFFPRAIETARTENAPNKIANYLEDLAAEYNTFYAAAPVIRAKTQKQYEERLRLSEAVHQVLIRGLYLLGITPPERM